MKFWSFSDFKLLVEVPKQYRVIITPRAHGGVHKKNKSTVCLEPIFYLSKYSLSELYFNTDRLLIEFNGLWYSLAARQVLVAIANPDSLSFG